MKKDTQQDIKNIGLSTDSSDKIKLLVEKNYFSQEADAFKFAVAYALSKGKKPDQIPDKEKTTKWNVNSINTEISIYDALKGLFDIEEGNVFRSMEKLGDWGIAEIYVLLEEKNKSFTEILSKRK